MAGDHCLLIGRHDPHLHGAGVRADPSRAGCIGGGIENDAEPGEVSEIPARRLASCSPMPAVNTSPSSPPTAATSRTASPARR
jgi:hypothetical protein